MFLFMTRKKMNNQNSMSEWFNRSIVEKVCSHAEYSSNGTPLVGVLCTMYTMYDETYYLCLFCMAHKKPLLHCWCVTVTVTSFVQFICCVFSSGFLAQICCCSCRVNTYVRNRLDRLDRFPIQTRLFPFTSTRHFKKSCLSSKYFLIILKLRFQKRFLFSVSNSIYQYIRDTHLYKICFLHLHRNNFH